LPRPWIAYHDLKFGDEVILLGNAVILVVPKEKEEKARKLLEKLEE